MTLKNDLNNLMNDMSELCNDFESVHSPFKQVEIAKNLAQMQFEYNKLVLKTLESMQPGEVVA